jgi:hypothetical protein
MRNSVTNNQYVANRKKEKKKNPRQKTWTMSELNNKMRARKNGKDMK